MKGFEAGPCGEKSVGWLLLTRSLQLAAWGRPKNPCLRGDISGPTTNWLLAVRRHFFRTPSCDVTSRPANI